MAEFKIEFDASAIVKWMNAGIKIGMEAIFLEMQEFEELEKDLNILGIDTNEDGETD